MSVWERHPGLFHPSSQQQTPPRRSQVKTLETASNFTESQGTSFLYFHLVYRELISFLSFLPWQRLEHFCPFLLMATGDSFSAELFPLIGLRLCCQTRQQS